MLHAAAAAGAAIRPVGAIWKGWLFDDPESEVGGVVRFDDLGSLESDRVGDVVEESCAGAEEDGGDVDCRRRSCGW
jgi:hypothetical protein